MTELIKGYIGQECLIYTMNSQVVGVIQDAAEGWIAVDNGKEIEAVNLDYVTRIRPYPRGKSGRKKSVVLD